MKKLVIIVVVHFPIFPTFFINFYQLLTKLQRKSKTTPSYGQYTNYVQNFLRKNTKLENRSSLSDRKVIGTS